MTKYGKGVIMGGRGASSGTSESGKKYGTEYKTLLSVSNIKFVQRINESDSAKAPLETMTKGRVYVTVNKDGELRYITYYDNNGKRTKTIDLESKHNDLTLHAHHGYNHNELDGKKGATGLTPEEIKMVERVYKYWNKKGK